MRQWIQRRVGQFAAMVDDAAELGGGLGAVLQLQLRLASQVRRPEFRDRRMIERASPARAIPGHAPAFRLLIAVAAAITGRITCVVRMASGKRRASSLDKSDASASAPHHASARPADSSVKLSRLRRMAAAASRRASAHWPTTA